MTSKNKVRVKPGKKSIIYEIIISILSFIFVILVGAFVGALLTEDFNYKKDADTFYYQIATDEYYSPYDIYEGAQINKAVGAEDEDLKTIYAYGDYYMDSFMYRATKGDVKAMYESRMKEDVVNMKELAGLKGRVDRLIEEYTR